MVPSVSQLAEVGLSENEANVDTIDVITSKVSTLPYDDDMMLKMIRLVQAAKGMPMCFEEEKDC
jgi:hypothetical protein